MTAETLKSQDFRVLLSNAFGDDKVEDTRKVFEFILNPKSLKSEVIDEVKNEIASRDFVRAEMAEVKLELKQDINKMFWNLTFVIVGSVVSAIVLLAGGAWAVLDFISKQ